MMRRGASVAGLTDGSPAWRLEGERSAGCRRAPQAPVGRPRPDTGLASRPMAGLSAVPMGGCHPCPIGPEATAMASRPAPRTGPRGVDTHLDLHLGCGPGSPRAALDPRGSRLDPGGVALVSWAERPGPVDPSGWKPPAPTGPAGLRAPTASTWSRSTGRPEPAAVTRHVGSDRRSGRGPGDPGRGGRHRPKTRAGQVELIRVRGWLGGGPQGPGGSRRAAIRAAVQRSRGAGPTTARAHDQAWSPPGPRRGPGP